MPSLLSLLAAVAAASLPGRRDVHYYSASAFLLPSASVVPPSSSRTTMRRVSSSAFDVPPPRLREGGCRDGADDGTTTTSTVPPPAAVLGAAVDGVVVGRRVAAGRLSSLLAAALAATTAAAPGAALAASSSDLFRPNPLTNPVLEKIRIWNQDEADNVVYGGELASGSSKPDGLDVYVGLLQPILGVERDLSEVDALLRKSMGGGGGGGGGGGEGALLAEIKVVLSKSKFDKLEFKRSFNAFADNIYYSDPDRANLYLGGGATPKASQSIAYLLRNEILTDVEDMRAEVRYLAGEVGKGGATAEGIIDLDEMYRLSESANVGMRKYLDLVPPRELVAARAEFSASPRPPSAP